MTASCDYEDFNLSSNPFDVFRQWFELAQTKEPMPDSFTLATTSSHGIPSARVLLYKGIQKDWFLFYTNYESMKAKEMMENPWASMVFYWPHLKRQIRITGSVQKASYAESDEYFQSRPRGSQIGAYASSQSKSIHSREDLIKRFEETKERFKGDEVIPCPQNWGGFQLRPFSFEFWMDGEDRLHDRFQYKLKKSDCWDIIRLAP